MWYTIFEENYAHGGDGVKLTGRTVIYANTEKITAANVIDVLQSALKVHAKNSREIDYLYNYYKGDQPILHRVKEIRPEICNMIVENRASEIVAFKTGYLIGEPIQYVVQGADERFAAGVTQLNEYMSYEDKESVDKELVDWMHIAGTGFRIILPDAYAQHKEDEAPFEIYALDPRNTFVVYSTKLGHRPLMGVTVVDTPIDTGVFGQTQTLYGVYTDNWYYEISTVDNGTTYKIAKAVPQMLGIPIVEYPLNLARIGAFEIVISLLDAINLTESDRVDGVDQFIQALLLFHNVQIDDEEFKKLKAEGAIAFKDIDPQTKAEITYLSEQLDQGQTQTLVDHMYQTVLTICGMPNRNGGSSTSDTGSAVILRDGWNAAEARAKDTELMFKKSEKSTLKLAIKICRYLANMDLKVSGVEIRFTRRNYENITQKVDVLDKMLNNPKIAPRLAFSYCGMFSDPNLAYEESKKHYEEEQKRLEEKEAAANEANNAPAGDGSGNQQNPDDGQGMRDSGQGR